MKKNKLAVLVLAIAAAMMMILASPAVSDEAATDNMQILLDKVKADKKLLVAANMQLTDSEAKGFWPVYETYQKDLMGINERVGGLILEYAEGYEAGTLADETVKTLITGLVDIQKAETELQSSYVPKLEGVLPPKKVLLYMQIESKIRAAIKYQLAAGIPLVE